MQQLTHTSIRIPTTMLVTLKRQAKREGHNSIALLIRRFVTAGLDHLRVTGAR
jgi:hypothetical protein